MKKIIPFLIVIISIELFSFLGLLIIGELPSFSYQSDYLQASQVQLGMRNVGQYSTGWSVIAPHPYFGYTDIETTFEEEVLVRHENKRDFVIGIFGGSVALSFQGGIGRDTLVKYLHEHHPELKNKNIIVKGYAYGAYKQPQSFFKAMYYGPGLDMSINIEGYNEALLRNAHSTDIYNSKAIVPESWPAFSDLFFVHDQNYYLEFGRDFYLRDLFKKLSRTLADNFLSAHSSFGYLLWKLAHKAIEKPEEREELALKEGQFHRSYEERVKAWEKYVRLQTAALKEIGVVSYYFLQPNYHYKGSKPISKEEITYPELLTEITNMYQIFEESVTKLNKDNFLVYELFYLFKDMPDKMYIDSAHLTPQAEVIMAKKIGEYIVRGPGRFHEAAKAAGL